MLRSPVVVTAVEGTTSTPVAVAVVIVTEADWPSRTVAGTSLSRTTTPYVTTLLEVVGDRVDARDRAGRRRAVHGGEGHRGGLVDGQRANVALRDGDRHLQGSEVGDHHKVRR